MFCFASRSASRQRDEGLDRDTKLRCLFPFHRFLFLTIFPVVLSPHPALASGYPARKWRGKPNFSSVFCRYQLPSSIIVINGCFWKQLFIKYEWIRWSDVFALYMQTPPPEQLNDSGHHERLDAGHPGAGWQRHHRQGDSCGYAEWAATVFTCYSCCERKEENIYWQPDRSV